MKVCVTVDMDNYRDYRSLVDPKSDSDGRSFYLDAIPRYLDLFDRHGIRATFFMIGRDGELPAHRKLVREIAARGHEVGNHSYTHPYNFRQLSRLEKEGEIARAEQAIADIVGERPVGFRTPSLDADSETLKLLAERGYLYESSVLPSLFLWAFMFYGRFFVRRSDYQLGPLTAAFAPPRPYLPCARRLHRPRNSASEPGPALVEIPFSVVPRLGIPFYATLLRLLGERFFDLLVRAYGLRHPVLHGVFHLIDLVDLEGSRLGEAIRQTPGLAVRFARRDRFMSHAMSTLSKTGDCVPLREVARACRAEHGLD